MHQARGTRLQRGMSPRLEGVRFVMHRLCSRTVGALLKDQVAE